MFPEILSKNAKSALAILGKSGLLRSAYLAGGTGLALQLGHRHSYDFDFFTTKKFDENMLLRQMEEILPGFKLERQGWQTILGHIKDTRFSLFFYKPPLLFPLHPFTDIGVADVKDIAAMKIAAIADRGKKRDFIDLYFLLAKKHILTLEETLALYERKFQNLAQNKIPILKSLVYFEDAEKDEVPSMIQTVSWKEVKKFFLASQQTLVKKLFQ